MKPVKLTQKQVRRLVESVVSEADGQINFAEELYDFVITAFDDMIVNFNDAGDRAAEAAEGRLGAQVPVPVRYEDVEPLADQIAAKVMQNQRMRNMVQHVARAMLHSLMEPKR